MMRNERMSSDSSVAQHRRGRHAGAAMLAALALALASPSLPVAAAEGGGGWIGTWAASPQPVWDPDFLAPIPFPRNLWNQTIREVARVSLGGNQARIVVSNRYGSRSSAQRPAARTSAPVRTKPRGSSAWRS